MKTKLSVADDHLAKLEADKKELSERLGQVSDSAKAKDKEIETLTQGKDSVDKENTKLKEKLKVFESAGSASGKSDKENDVIIAVSNFVFSLFETTRKPSGQGYREL